MKKLLETILKVIKYFLHVDLYLAQGFKPSAKIWSLFEISHSVMIPDIVFYDDIDIIKSNILYIQYNDKQAVDFLSNTL